MTKQNFLNSLRISLNGKISPKSVEENLSYYEDYIITEMRLGKTEQEVLSSLGDPRLIARSIVEASGSEEDYETYESPYYKDERSESKSKRAFRIPWWIWIFVILVIVIVILGAIFSIIWSLLPILLPIGFAFFFVNWFLRDR